MPIHHHPLPISRRTLIRQLGLVALGAALAPAGALATLPLKTTLPHADHTILGHWLALTPLGPAHMLFDTDGTVLIAWPHSGEGPNGYYEYTTSATGTWQPTSTHRISLHVVAEDAALDGSVTGTTTIESRLEVSIDGSTFQGDAATDRLISTSPDGGEALWLGDDGRPLPMSGIRMWPEESTA